MEMSWIWMNEMVLFFKLETLMRDMRGFESEKIERRRGKKAERKMFEREKRVVKS